MLKVKKSKVLTYPLLAFFCISFFIWLNHIPFPQDGKGIIVYTNYNHCLKKILLYWIKQAKQSIFLENFSIKDDDIIKAIQKKSFLDKEIKTHEGKTNHKLMHKKILVIDKRVVLLGSTNCTRSSLLVHDNLMIGIANENLARAIHDKKGYYSDGHLEYFELPAQKKKVMALILNQIQNAKQSIVVVMYYLSHKSIIGALLQAAERGVKISVIVDNHCPFFYYKNLKENPSIEIIRHRGLKLMHHKLCFIDGSTLIFGSLNWTKKGLTRNEEFVMCLHHLGYGEQKQIKKLLNTLSHR